MFRERFNICMPDFFHMRSLRLYRENEMMQP